MWEEIAQGAAKYYEMKQAENTKENEEMWRQTVLAAIADLKQSINQLSARLGDLIAAVQDVNPHAYTDDIFAKAERLELMLGDWTKNNGATGEIPNENPIAEQLADVCFAIQDQCSKLISNYGFQYFRPVILGAIAVSHGVKFVPQGRAVFKGLLQETIAYLDNALNPAYPKSVRAAFDFHMGQRTAIGDYIHSRARGNNWLIAEYNVRTGGNVHRGDDIDIGTVRHRVGVTICGDAGISLLVSLSDAYPNEPIYPGYETQLDIAYGNEALKRDAIQQNLNQQNAVWVSEYFASNELYGFTSEISIARAAFASMLQEIDAGARIGASLRFNSFCAHGAVDARLLK